MGFWFVFFMFVGFTCLNELLRPKLNQQGPKASALGDFTLPTAMEGRCIPAMWGTCKVVGGNVVWYGDLRVEAIQQWVKTGIFSGEHVTTGHKYYLGVQMALACGPVDAVVAILFDNKNPGFARTVHGAYDDFSINNNGLFGGDQAEGGIVGTVSLYYGGTSQVANGYLTSRIGALPGYRGVCYAVLNQMYLGTSPYIKPIAFVLRRCPNTLGLTSSRERIGNDANPACMLYELFTDPKWGLGLGAGSLDVASFVAAGNSLYTEGFGLSMLIDSPTTAWDLSEQILRHIDGVIFTDPFTGLLTLKLARADYVVADLDLYDESNVDSVALSRPGWNETKNYVRVRYTDSANDWVERIAYECDLANVQIRAGTTAILDVDYHGISTAANAQKVAARDLKSVSYPMGRYSIVMNRVAWAIRPGSVFKLTWPALGLSNVVLRTIKASSGDASDERVRIEAVEDIFAVSWTSNPAPGDTGWTDPLTTVGAMSQQRLEEAPYAFEAGRRVLTLAVRGTGTPLGYQVWSDPAGGTSYALTNTIPALTPSALCVGALSITATSLTVDNGTDAAVLASISAADLALGNNIMLIDDELIAWQTVTDNGDGTYALAGLVRGCCDTAPRSHADNARVWFVTGGTGETAMADYPAELTVAAKLLPYNSLGTLAITSATAMSKTTTSRATRPYCPRALLVNGASYPATATNPVTASWGHRNRLTSWSYANAGSTAAIETGCQYRVKWYLGGSGTATRDVVTTTLSDTYSPTAGAVKIRVYCEVIASGLTSKDYLEWEGTVS